MSFRSYKLVIHFVGGCRGNEWGTYLWVEALMKGERWSHLCSWCLQWRMSPPRDTLAPVCEGVDDLMKMSHFACQIIWHLFSAPSVRDSGVGALVWRAALSDWQWGPVSMTEQGSTSLFCFDRTLTWQSICDCFFFKCSVQLKALEPMGKTPESILLEE